MDVANQSGLWTKLKSARPTRLQQEARIGLLFLAPWLIGFVLLKALPILAALIFSLTDFKMLSPETTKYIGLENYIRFFRDSEAGASLFGSLGYFLLTVLLEMMAALALAAMFTSERLKNKRISPTLIFMIVTQIEKGLFIGLAFGCLAMRQRQKWFLAALLAVAATMTRAVGGALAMLFAFDMWVA